MRKGNDINIMEERGLNGKAVSRYLRKIAAGLTFVTCSLAIALSCYIAGRAGSWSLATVAVLLAGALFAVVPVCNSTIDVLQKVVTVYVVCFFVKQANLEYIATTLADKTVNVSWGVPIIFLCFIGNLGHRLSSGTHIGQRDSFGNVVVVWLLAISVVVAHMLLLWSMFLHHYGYGYERDWHVMGQIGLIFLVSVLLWRVLPERWFRIYVGIALIACFLVSAV